MRENVVCYVRLRKCVRFVDLFFCQSRKTRRVRRKSHVMFGKENLLGSSKKIVMSVLENLSSSLKLTCYVLLGKIVTIREKNVSNFRLFYILVSL